MTDKKTEELNEAELDQVTGGLYSTHGAGTELKKQPGAENVVLSSETQEPSFKNGGSEKVILSSETGNPAFKKG